MCCIRDVTLPLLLNSFVMKRGHSWKVKSMFRCSLIWQRRAVSFWQYRANNWFFFPCRSPVRIISPFSIMFPQYDKQRCIIFVSPPLCCHFRDILDVVFNSEVTFINAPCHDKVEKLSSALSQCKTYWKVIFESVNLMA